MEKMDGQVRGTCSAGSELTQGPSTCCVPRPGFSKNSPVWLLGCAYHRKLVEGPGGGEGGGSPVGGQVTTFTETDSGIEAFEKDYRSKVRLDEQPVGEPVPRCGCPTGGGSRKSPAPGSPRTVAGAACSGGKE